MRHKKIKFKYRKENVLISDVLPYEVPLNFTNKHFYNFLIENRIEITDNQLSWKSGSDALDEIIHILFGLPRNEKYLSLAKDDANFKIYNLCRRNGKSKCRHTGMIPFSYKISHKENGFRELAVPHPISQIKVANFYNRYKETIIYYCSQSSFSIRHPYKLAKYKFHKDKTHYQNLTDDLTDDTKEEKGKEYENLRSFFVYKDYSNIYKFFESYRYQRCEKKYDKLQTLDITKCFDSIYTHSLSWALLGKNNVKENLDSSRRTFSGRFDELMQSMNYQETNGIIIGPEFSRIFAELILQSIDKSLERELEKTHKLKHKSDYEILRYVDDYFIFYNDESTMSNISDCLQHKLKEYKLYLNLAKSVKYDRPFITDISRAKQRMVTLLEEIFFYNPEKVKEDGEKSFGRSIFIKQNSLITEFKIIIKECNVNYGSLLNYTFAIIQRKSSEFLKKYTEASSPYRSQKQLVKAILVVLEFSFFIYAASPTVSTTIKLCRIINLFCYFANRKIKKSEANGLEADDPETEYIDFENKHLIFKNIYDNIRLVLKKNKTKKYTQVETLYLLVVLSELGRNYRLEQDVLAEYFNIYKEDEQYTCRIDFNYFSYVVLLFYMKEKVRYKDLRKYIEERIIQTFAQKLGILNKDAELTMLALDIISCPYISDMTKKIILSKCYKSEDPQSIIDFKNKNGSKQFWFITWHDFNFGKELDTKQGQEVY